MTVPDGRTGIDFLLLMEDYQGSYTEAFRAAPELQEASYEESAKRLFSRSIYYGDAYVNGLASRGFTADQVVPACRPLQFKWARAHGLWNPSDWIGRIPLDARPVLFSKQVTDQLTLSRILIEQIAGRRPKIVWLFSGIRVTAREVRAWRRHAEHVMLWWSCPLVDGFPYERFDLILSSIPSLVRHFEDRGIRAAHLSHAFDRRICDRIPSLEARIPRVAFVGNLAPNYGDRIAFLDALSRHVPIDFYGHGEQYLPEDSPLRRAYRGPAWGDELYSVYGSHLIVVHKNIDVAEKSASAKRLFEATGMGACVVTEASDDLADLFVPGEEVITYSGVDDCVEKIGQLLTNPERAREIGRRGQQRTLTDHTYERRVDDLLSHVKALGLL